MAMDHSTNLKVSGGAVSIGGSVVGGRGNVVGAPAGEHAAAVDLTHLLTALEATLRAARDLPARERDELADDVARARAAAGQPQPNLRRAATLLTLSRETLEGFVGTAASAATLVAMVSRALGLVPPA